MRLSFKTKNKQKWRYFSTIKYADNVKYVRVRSSVEYDNESVTQYMHTSSYFVSRITGQHWVLCIL